MPGAQTGPEMAQTGHRGGRQPAGAGLARPERLPSRRNDGPPAPRPSPAWLLTGPAEAMARGRRSL